ncbi:hypothetical protein SRHO_G00260600 [Serrasalmus rhombeus]
MTMGKHVVFISNWTLLGTKAQIRCRIRPVTGTCKEDMLQHCCHIHKVQLTPAALRSNALTPTRSEPFGKV